MPVFSRSLKFSPIPLPYPAPLALQFAISTLGVLRQWWRRCGFSWLCDLAYPVIHNREGQKKQWSLIPDLWVGTPCVISFSCILTLISSSCLFIDCSCPIDSLHLKRAAGFTPADVDQWIEHQPVNQKVTGSIPSQGTRLDCGPGLQLGALSNQLMLLSFSFSLPSPLSKNK